MKDVDDVLTEICLFVLAILLAIAVLCGAAGLYSTFARDLGQWENQDPELRQWFEALKQPDNPQIPCCGEADAYWCDDVRADETGTYCKITDTRDDVSLKRPHIDVGTEIWIPPSKFGPKHWGNPTNHTVVFIGYNSKNVYCFIQATGI